MPTVDSDHQRIELRILVFGGASDCFLGSLGLEAGSLALGILQGWRPTLSFCSFGVDPWAESEERGRALETQLPYTDALVLTDGLAGGEHYSSKATERLWRCLGPAQRGIPTAVFGHRALAEEWQSLSGVAPIAIHDPIPAQAQPIVRAVATVLLRSRLRSIPPPPRLG